MFISGTLAVPADDNLSVSQSGYTGVTGSLSVDGC